MSQSTSQKPYFLRGLYEWCTDNGYTPHITVQVDERTRVPMQFVQEGQITLNISAQATTMLNLGNELIEFNARFAGKLHRIEVPVSNVVAIYARETSEGMAFQVVPAAQAPSTTEQSTAADQPPPPEAPKKGFLSVVK